MPLGEELAFASNPIDGAERIRAGTLELNLAQLQIARRKIPLQPASRLRFVRT